MAFGREFTRTNSNYFERLDHSTGSAIRTLGDTALNQCLLGDADLRIIDPLTKIEKKRGTPLSFYVSKWPSWYEEIRPGSDERALYNWGSLAIWSDTAGTFSLLRLFLDHENGRHRTLDRRAEGLYIARYSAQDKDILDPFWVEHRIQPDQTSTYHIVRLNETEQDNLSRLLHTAVTKPQTPPSDLVQYGQYFPNDNASGK